MIGRSDLSADRVPPHDVDTEGALLGSVLYEPERLSLVSWLAPDEFYSEANRRIFEAALWLAQQGKPADVMSVAGRLRDTSRLDQVGGTTYLAQLAAETPAGINIEEYATRIRDLGRRRQFIRECASASARGYDCSEPTDELFVAHEQAIFELSHDSRSRHSEGLGTTVRHVFEEIVEASQSGQTMVGVPTGFERFDALTAGLHPGELTIIAARPGMGKTSYVMNIARNVASAIDEVGAHRQGVMVFSLEMSRDQLAKRWVCSEARVHADRLRMPSLLSDADWAALTDACKDLYRLPIEVDDTPGIGLVEIGGKARRAEVSWGQSGAKLALVIVDYIQLAKGSQLGNREQEISSLSRGLKGLAKQLEVPIVALSQLNRSVETQGGKDKRPQLAALRESGSLEQDADNVVFVYRDDYYNSDSPDKGIAELIVAKQRNGPTGTVKVKFTGAYTRFDNLQPGEGDDEAPGEYPTER